MGRGIAVQKWDSNTPIDEGDCRPLVLDQYFFFFFAVAILITKVLFFGSLEFDFFILNQTSPPSRSEEGAKRWGLPAWPISISSWTALLGPIKAIDETLLPVYVIFIRPWLCYGKNLPDWVNMESYQNNWFEHKSAFHFRVNKHDATVNGKLQQNYMQCSKM